jgi:hypothetical protein
VAGFLLGSAAFWIYGLWVSPADFLNDHLRTHIVERAVAAAPAGGEYLGAGTLWLEFLRDTSYLLVPAGIVALRRHVDGFMIIWAVSSGLAFTLVDWKMTKHLAEIFLLCPVIALGVATWRGRMPRLITQTIVVVTIALNIVTLVRLSHDFGSLIKLPEW